MPKHRTKKSPFESRYGGNWISPAQYITEYICEKKSSGDLPDKFWQQEKWKSYFRQQVFAANGLLSLYSPKAIIQALRDRRAYRVYSLRAPFLDPIIAEKQRHIDLQDKKEVVIPDTNVDINEQPRKPMKKSSILKRLRDTE